MLIPDNYPQNKHVAEFCPSGTTYARHVCGTGAKGWLGSGSTQYGPFSENKYLANNGDHCACCCDCNTVTVECL